MNLNADVGLITKYQVPTVLMNGRTSRFQYLMIMGDNQVYDKEKLDKYITWLTECKEIMTDALTAAEKQTLISEVVSVGQQLEQVSERITDTVPEPEPKIEEAEVVETVPNAKLDENGIVEEVKSIPSEAQLGKTTPTAAQFSE